jgi:aldehyde:ferredoxin oxidoreductase
MMQLGGYANHVGRINLTTGDVKYEGIPEDWARKYIGARGLGVRYCLEAGATVDPLGPEKSPLLHERAPNGYTR